MPIVQYIVVNREILALGPGTLASQAAHASMAGYLVARDSEPARAWAEGTFTKIVLAVVSEAALREVATALAAAGVPHKVIEESRLGAKATAVGVAPVEKESARAIVGKLALLR